MRIAVIAPPWTPVPPKLYGGIELVVDRLATGFQRAGHDVLLFTTGDSTCPVPKQWTLPEAEHQRIGMVVPELRHIMAAYEAVAGYDIVHDHTVMGPVYAQRFPDIKVVTTNHGPFNDELVDIYRRIVDRVPLIHISHAQGRPAPHIPAALGTASTSTPSRSGRATAGTASSWAGCRPTRVPTGPPRSATGPASP
jgi:glycosyltransferase involved in cell wall biosynthesis